MADAKTQEASKPAHPGERLASYFENFFRTILGIATLGASLTFNRIVSTPVIPFHDFGFSAHRIQWFLALSWLLFVLALAFTSCFASLLSLYRPQAVKAFGTKLSGERRTVMWYVTLVSGLLFGLVIGAFVFVSLVVVGYAGPVGWVTVGFCVVFGVGGFGSIIYQSPIFMGRGAESDVLSPVMGRTFQDGEKGNPGRKDGVRVEGRYVDDEGGYGGGVQSSPGHFDDWRYSRNGSLRVQEFNRRSRKDPPM